MQEKGFTLLELVVVIVIIGILATLGLVQYTKVMEKGRTAEARTSLGLLRKLQTAYNQEKGGGASAWADIGDIIGAGLPSGTNNTCGASGTALNYYFQYTCTSSSGTCTAYRCATGGKSPVTGTTANITLTTGGSFTETGF